MNHGGYNIVRYPATCDFCLLFLLGLTSNPLGVRFLTRPSVPLPLIRPLSELRRLQTAEDHLDTTFSVQTFNTRPTSEGCIVPPFLSFLTQGTIRRYSEQICTTHYASDKRAHVSDSHTQTWPRGPHQTTLTLSHATRRTLSKERKLGQSNFRGQGGQPRCCLYLLDSGFRSD